MFTLYIYFHGIKRTSQLSFNWCKIVSKCHNQTILTRFINNKKNYINQYKLNFSSCLIVFKSIKSLQVSSIAKTYFQKWERAHIILDILWGYHILRIRWNLWNIIQICILISIDIRDILRTHFELYCVSSYFLHASFNYNIMLRNKNIH